VRAESISLKINKFILREKIFLVSIIIFDEEINEMDFCFSSGSSFLLIIDRGKFMNGYFIAGTVIF